MTVWKDLGEREREREGVNRIPFNDWIFRADDTSPIRFVEVGFPSPKLDLLLSNLLDRITYLTYPRFPLITRHFNRARNAPCVLNELRRVNRVALQVDSLCVCVVQGESLVGTRLYRGVHPRYVVAWVTSLHRELRYVEERERVCVCHELLLLSSNGGARI